MTESKLEKAARAFSKQLRAVEDSEDYRTVWTIHHRHGGQYSGPNYIAEREEFEKALSAFPEEQ